MHKKIEKILNSLAQEDNISQDMLYDLMNYQFHIANKAIHDQKSIEISGFCSLRIRENKRQQKIKALMESERRTEKAVHLYPEGDRKRNTVLRKLEVIREDIKLINNES